jgi:hypothetical protein
VERSRRSPSIVRCGKGERMSLREVCSLDNVVPIVLYHRCGGCGRTSVRFPSFPPKRPGPNSDDGRFMYSTSMSIDRM